jgi:hypothetical protein
MHGAVKRHNGLAGARRARDAGWPGVIALDPLPLFGMQEDRPFLPREIEGALQFLHVGHHAETALGVGMLKGIGGGEHWLRHAGLAAGRKFQQGLGCLGWQMIG